jgi:hypothetical protein
VDTVGVAAPNVGEYWTDLHWDGSKLGRNQDPARQALCDLLDSTGDALSLFDFPTKGILQVLSSVLLHVLFGDICSVSWFAEKCVAIVSAGGSCV